MDNLRLLTIISGNVMTLPIYQSIEIQECNIGMDILYVYAHVYMIYCSIMT